MTPSSPEGPEREARPEEETPLGPPCECSSCLRWRAEWEARPLQERVAHEISRVDGRASSVEPCGDATYEQMADAALAVVTPELDRLTAEVAQYRRQYMEMGSERDDKQIEVERLRRVLARVEQERDSLRAQLDKAVVLPPDAEHRIGTMISAYRGEMPSVIAAEVLAMLQSWAAADKLSSQGGDYLGSGQQLAWPDEGVCPECHCARPIHKTWCNSIDGPSDAAVAARSEATPEDPSRLYDNPSARVSTVEGSPPPWTPLVSWEHFGGRPSGSRAAEPQPVGPTEPPASVAALAQPPGSYWKYLIRGTKSGWYFSNSLTPVAPVAEGSGWGWAFSRAELPLTQVTQVRDVHGDVWTWVPGTHEWSSPETQNCAWTYMARKWAPLTEVPTSSLTTQEENR